MSWKERKLASMTMVRTRRARPPTENDSDQLRMSAPLFWDTERIDAPPGPRERGEGVSQRGGGAPAGRRSRTNDEPGGQQGHTQAGAAAVGLIGGHDALVLVVTAFAALAGTCVEWGRGRARGGQVKSRRRTCVGAQTRWSFSPEGMKPGETPPWLIWARAASLRSRTAPESALSREARSLMAQHTSCTDLRSCMACMEPGRGRAG